MGRAQRKLLQPSRQEKGNSLSKNAKGFVIRKEGKGEGGGET